MTPLSVLLLIRDRILDWMDNNPVISDLISRFVLAVLIVLFIVLIRHLF